MGYLAELGVGGIFCLLLFNSAMQWIDRARGKDRKDITEVLTRIADNQTRILCEIAATQARMEATLEAHTATLREIAHDVPHARSGNY